ncbi:hypothetical protein CCACVL1_22698 [Corchorus capsularis]|uniref:Uncharacterized protein n=1 Tax=Corchorus capsularis TaxID=210143 RepID=A0A1R3GXE0_COCAP|nr:hypothetical protein CCACVL1_22698 [Corchorus capsularis]
MANVMVLTDFSTKEVWLEHGFGDYGWSTGEGVCGKWRRVEQ